MAGKKRGGGEKYVVRLSAEERTRLEEFLHKGRPMVEVATRARILLKAGESKDGPAWTDRRIVEAPETSLNNVSRARKRLVEQGFEAVLTRQYNPACARPKIFDGDAEAKLIAVACSKPPDGRAHWTLRLLEEKVVELGTVERASDNTIGRILKKTSSSRTSRNSGSFRPTPTPTSSPAWRTCSTSTGVRTTQNDPSFASTRRPSN